MQRRQCGTATGPYLGHDVQRGLAQLAAGERNKRYAAHMDVSFAHVLADAARHVSEVCGRHTRACCVAVYGGGSRWEQQKALRARPPP